MNEFILILGMFVVTFGFRYPVLAFVSRIRLPHFIERALKYVPPAVLSAIIVPEILLPNGTNPDFSLNNPALIAGLVAVLISYKTKNLLLTIILGMAVFFGIRWLLAFLSV